MEQDLAAILDFSYTGRATYQEVTI